MAFTYDAFLSYNSKDRDAVTAIARHLKEKAGLKIFFDQWEIIAGSPVQETLEKALAESATCVIFIGPSGLGPYQNEETRLALEKRITEKDIRVIPVLLPGGKRETRESALPPFLRRLSWVEFSDDPLDLGALHRLVCGIKNVSPGPGEKATAPSPDICPYRGLEVFREQDQEFFFGRESLVQRLIARLQSSRFLALIGPSGSGKSSVVQAGLIPSLRSDSLIALLTPRERPLEELAFAMRKAAAPGQINYSTAEIIKQLSDSEESVHYLAREILQSMPGDRSKPIQRFVIIVDQLEEIFTLIPLEQDRRKFINLLLRAVEIAGGPVTVILAMRSDFIGKCAPYRDLNIYFSEHLDQVEPMTPAELQAAIENPAKSVGLEFEEGLVEVMLTDVKGSGSELPLVEHALLELFNYQPRPGNRLTAQAYEAIGRVEGALVRRAEKLYEDMSASQQETMRKMFLWELIQSGEGVSYTPRRALKEKLLAVGGDAAEAEKLLYRLATARLLTIGRDKDSGQVTVEVAHEALIRNWRRIGEWMAEGREITRQRGILRQAAREWDKNGKNPDYLFRGTQLALMEEFVSTHQQDLGTLEKEFISAGTVEREVLKREKRSIIQAFIGALVAVLLVVAYFAYQTDWNVRKALANEKEALRQLAVNYWDTARRLRDDNDHLKSIHIFCEALTIEKDKRFQEVLLTDMKGLWRTAPLLQIFPHEDIKGARFNKDETLILTWSEKGTAQLWDAAIGKPIGEVMKPEEGVNGAIFNRDNTLILTWGDVAARLRDSGTGTPTWRYVAVRLLGTPPDKVMKHKEGVNGATFNPDEKLILTWSKDDTVRLWDAEDGKPFGEVMKHEDDVNGAIFDRQGTLILTWSKDDTVRLWDAEDGKPIGKVMKHEDDVNGAIFNKNENRILTWSDDKTARLWDAATGKPTGVVMKHEDEVNGAIFNKNENRILTWSDDKTARLWDAATGKPTGEVMKHGNEVNGAIFNQNETHILTWSDDSTTRLWNADTGKPTGEVMKHDGFVNGAVFSKNENLILTWSKDGTVRLWDAADGRPIGEVMEHNKKEVKGAIFNKKETRILTWSGDGTARLWDIAIDPDFPIDQIKLQVMAITGTSHDTIANTVNVLPPEEWRKIKKQYMELAGQHYKTCRYPEGNVFRRLFPKEAQKIRPYPPKPDKPEPKRD